jgi:hypothetical protein
MARSMRERGLAAVEFALLLPFLVTLGLLVADFARALQSQIILLNISREGANLAARAPAYSQQQIMDALAATTPPLHMQDHGMMYVTTVMGHLENGVVRNVVVGQSRWLDGYTHSRYVPASRIWNCGSNGSRWNGDGSCGAIPAPGPGAPTAPLMQNQLADGETIYAVETFYAFDMFFGSLDFGGGITTPQIGPNLSAITVM